MRGDRPGHRSRRLGTAQATPHARGSTTPGSPLGRHALGYPACAGIDLLPMNRISGTSWLPRMRGDRPCHIIDIVCSERATPHARGSTHHERTAGRGQAGYPACAGIDPHPETPAGARRGLPRMRGDRPSDDRAIPTDRLATPHARGSTLLRAAAAGFRAGYPACAGIDPKPAHQEPLGWGLPRMRGDRPWPRSKMRSNTRATPHARGSTHYESSFASAICGYPACAGIDLLALTIIAKCCRLPRMRGDRPKGENPTLIRTEATPHARGSTSSC